VQRSAVHEVLGSPGRPLEAADREDMEARLGADFSDVRVHTDSTAHRAAESVGAHAFTAGSHVAFQRGRYDTGSTAGRRLLMTGRHRRAYPNVRARLRRRTEAPGAPAAEASMVIWLSGQRFRVRDETGRPYAEIVADVTTPRGFGVTPRTMEEFMDAWHASRHPSRREPTELYGDWETGEAVVHEQHHDP
jgi:hypothetical protein